jgi:enolase-phosphatase E1
MIHFYGSGILLDVEGTTSSIQFVHDVLFPYAREHLAEYLRRHWHEPVVQDACSQIVSPQRQQGESLAGAVDFDQVLAETYRLMDIDAKATSMKALQGLIWDEGYRAGKLKTHLFDDVVPALRQWNERRFDVRIFSSGSIAAQKAFFSHTAWGDLLPLFHGHYDTTIGNKRHPDSYRRIAQDMSLPAEKILFLSDIPAELDAAQEAGLQTGLALRPGNGPVAKECMHPQFASFAEVVV